MIPEVSAKIVFEVIAVINLVIVFKYLLPVCRRIYTAE